MSEFRVGAYDPLALYIGANEVSAVYYGSTRIWPDANVIAVPYDSLHWTNYAPSISTGVNIGVPLNSMSWADFSPGVELGGFIPADLLAWTDFAPVVAGGAHIAAPVDEMNWADFVPSVSISVVVNAPADPMDWADYAPVVVSGANIDAEVDELIWTNYAPSVVAGVNITMPADQIDWRDFGVVTGYGFSTGFSSGFPAIPGASGATLPASDGLSWQDFAPTIEAESQVEASYLGYFGLATRAGAVHTVAGHTLGAAAAGRKILAVVHAFRFGSTSMSFSSATIRGVDAVLIGQASGTITGVRHSVYLIGAEVPDGATGDTVVTMGQSTSEIGVFISAYRAMNLNSLIPALPENLGETGWDSSSTSVRSASADVPANGLFLAAATVSHDGGTNTFTGIANDYHELYSADKWHFFGGHEVLAAAATRTATFTKSGGAGSMHGGIVAVGLR